MSQISVYIHIPFCKHRCGYCDFNTYAGLIHMIPDYVRSLCAEIEYLSHGSRDDLTVATIYFGGGTPSLLSPSDVDLIISKINRGFAFLPDQEISLEANPGTVSKQYLSDLRATGVNRLSLGMQSANERELRLLERQHSFSDVNKAVDWAREAGFEQINLDLIFGLPNQTLEDWSENIEAALSMQPDHLSLYALTLEEGTPLHNRIIAGYYSEPDPDLAADMYETASERLFSAGYQQYEISNWAYSDHDRKYGKNYCRHNLQYWHNLPYLGLGAGAHGFTNHNRTENVLSPGEYISKFSSFHEEPRGLFPRTPATQKITTIDRDTEIGETMMLGLRLVDEGVSNQDFMYRYDTSLYTRFGAQIDRLIKLGLLEWSTVDDVRLRLTKRGRLLGNQVFQEFI